MIQTQAIHSDQERNDRDMTEKKTDRPDRYTAPPWLFGPPLDHSGMDLLAEAASICEREDAEGIGAASSLQGIALSAGQGYALVAERPLEALIFSDSGVLLGTGAGRDGGPASGGSGETGGMTVAPQLLQPDIVLADKSGGGAGGEQKWKQDLSPGALSDGDHHDDSIKRIKSEEHECSGSEAATIAKRRRVMGPMGRDDEMSFLAEDEAIPNVVLGGVLTEESAEGWGRRRTGGCESDEPAAVSTHEAQQDLGLQPEITLGVFGFDKQERGHQAASLLRTALPGLLEACRAIVSLGLRDEAGLLGLHEAVDLVQSACDLLGGAPPKSL